MEDHKDGHDQWGKKREKYNVYVCLKPPSINSQKSTHTIKLRNLYYHKTHKITFIKGQVKKVHDL